MATDIARSSAASGASARPGIEIIGRLPEQNPSSSFPNGLERKNIIIQGNITPGPNPPSTNPSGSPCAIYLIGAGFIGANSKKVGEDVFLQGIIASVDLIFTEPNHTGWASSSAW